MLSKQSIIVALVGLNLLLLTAVLMVGYTPPAALAQEATPSAGSDIIVMAAQVEIGNDVTYVLDTRNQLLHAFRTPFPHMDNDPVFVTYVGSRDLSRDFKKEVRR